MITRRNLLTHGALLAGGATLLRSAAAAQSSQEGHAHQHATRSEPDPHAGHAAAAPQLSRASTKAETPARTGDYTPVVAPDGRTLPFRVRDGVKEFHLVAEPVEVEIADGYKVTTWGYNGSTPGPTIEAVEGDRVRIYVTNRLPEHTTIHWHGIYVPSGMDGVGGVNQPHIRPGETYVYEFTLRQNGTFMYHPHADEMLQQAMGMVGFFIIHPRTPPRRIDRDYTIFLHTWYIEPGSTTPDPAVMLDFNLFTFNGRVFPGTAPLVAGLNERVRLRFANLSMTSHPIHIHGHTFWEVETDGGPIPESAWQPQTSVNVPAGSTRVVEFVADNPGDWALHCHKNHHAMNAMGHDVPNMLGVDQSGVSEKLSRLIDGYMPTGSTGMAEHAAHGEHMPGVENTVPMMAGQGPYGPIEMGGMFTLIKIREGLTSYEDPGWYAAPAGTVAWKLDDPSDLPPT